jgi:Domain of unknown function (DUF4157)
MAKEHVPGEEKKAKVHKPEVHEQDKGHAGGTTPQSSLANLQQQVGNQAVQRLLAPHSGAGPVQRSQTGPAELDDETAKRINQERSGGQPLETGLGQQMGAALQSDLSGVRVHTSPAADQLNRQLSAKAFTTGQDIFFRQGAYEPHSSGGQELIAHELTHVVQQSSGQVSGSGPMTVNAPGDHHEQEAEATAKSLVQRQAAPKEEEEEEVQTKRAEQEEEGPVQMQPNDEEEEEAA